MIESKDKSIESKKLQTTKAEDTIHQRQYVSGERTHKLLNDEEIRSDNYPQKESCDQ